ncbi:uncharacterized protein LOC120342511 [Styela clava]
MKQSKINSYFSPGDLKHGSSGSALHFRQTNTSDKRGLFYSTKDPTAIYEEILKRKKQEFKFSKTDHMGLENDLSSQNSSQLLLNSQLNSQNSQSFAGNSSYSDDGLLWYQQYISKPQNSGIYRSQSRSSSRQSYTSSNTHSQDFKQSMEHARRKSKEKEEKDMLSNFLSLVKEHCEETKNTVVLNTGKCDAQTTQGFSSSLAKMEEILLKLSGVENLVKGKKELEDKITSLETQLDEKTSELDRVRAELDKYRREADNLVIEKLTEVFDRGQQMQTDKIEELVSNTTKIESHLKKPKLQTADMWCQYSPQLPLLNPKENLRSSISFPTSNVSQSMLKSSANNSINRFEPRVSAVGTSMSIVPIRQDDFQCSFNPPNQILPLPPSYNDVSDSTPFVVPTILLPRHPNSVFSHQKASSGHSLDMIRPVVSYPSHSSLGNIPNTLPSVQPITSICGSPFQNVGYSWSKQNKSSPIATVMPQQHLVPRESQRIPQNEEPLIQSWQDMAHNQSQEWFARPNTRSMRTPKTQQQTSTSNTMVTAEPYQDDALGIDQSTDSVVAYKKPKITKRKRQFFTRKKGKPQKKSANTLTQQLGNNGGPLDLDEHISWTENQDPQADTGNVNSMYPCFPTQPNVKAALGDKTNALANSTCINVTNIKQEDRDIINNSFPVRRQAQSSSWITLSDSDDESSVTDDDYSFSQEIKENQPFRKPYSSAFRGASNFNN